LYLRGFTLAFPSAASGVPWGPSGLLKTLHTQLDEFAVQCQPNITASRMGDNMVRYSITSLGLLGTRLSVFLANHDDGSGKASPTTSRCTFLIDRDRQTLRIKEACSSFRCRFQPIILSSSLSSSSPLEYIIPVSTAEATYLIWFAATFGLLHSRQQRVSSQHQHPSDTSVLCSDAPTHLTSGTQRPVAPEVS
jgi:hypothetical protein